LILLRKGRDRKRDHEPGWGTANDKDPDREKQKEKKKGGKKEGRIDRKALGELFWAGSR